MLVAFALLLVIVDRRARSDRPFDSIGPKEGLLLGTAQALALQPGVSRSGVTITAARAMGLDRESAARFSFLLSLPIIAGAGAYKAVDLAQTGLQGHAAEFVAGMVASAISGFLVIWGVLKYLKRHDFMIFLWYRVAVAAIGDRPDHRERPRRDHLIVRERHSGTRPNDASATVWRAFFHGG